MSEAATPAYVVEFYKRYFWCPLCESSRSANIRRRSPAGDWGERWWVGCYKCDGGPGPSEAGRQYLHRLADAVGCKPIDLLQRADEVLEPYLRPKSSDSKAARLPLNPQLQHWESNLVGRPLDYLTDERGISEDVLIERRVGYDPKTRRLVFPMFDQIGRLVAYKFRRPRAGQQMLSPKGHCDWPLYPHPRGAARVPLLICAGELDALCAISAGVDACSVTLGAPTWLDAWTAQVRQRVVVLCFDNNEGRFVEHRRAELQAVGVNARVADLRSLGLDTAKGDVSDYLLDGGRAAELVKGAR